MNIFSFYNEVSLGTWRNGLRMVHQHAVRRLVLHLDTTDLPKSLRITKSLTGLRTIYVIIKREEDRPIVEQLCVKYKPEVRIILEAPYHSSVWKFLHGPGGELSS